MTCNPGQKSWDTFAKTPQIRPFPLHPLCNVDLKGPSHPESLQALSTLLGEGGGRAVIKAVRYKQGNRLTQGIFHNDVRFCAFFPGVPRTFSQGRSPFKFPFGLPLRISLDNALLTINYFLSHRSSQIAGLQHKIIDAEQGKFIWTVAFFFRVFHWKLVPFHQMETFSITVSLY